MANVPTLECSRVEDGVVVGCSSEEGRKDIDQTNCSVLVKSSIGFPEGLRSVEVEEFEGPYGVIKNVVTVILKVIQVKFEIFLLHKLH